MELYIPIQNDEGVWVDHPLLEHLWDTFSGKEVV
jgi:hypothetical protein